ncbi:thioesterase [Paenibacillus sp. G2S3]|uniref:acyl-[acyl-carrier-protein] thioesterase n=1 Tax=Paenibacillus sp. G2S3 TaxID=3047872 RepID=UPI0024C1CDAE|nr:acyl-ACP thioesterase domain-containing protein [Paenibacillus sp. G2S3]WHY20046.1 thioesterase [Paenibacillus sp. G2S3]
MDNSSKLVWIEQFSVHTSDTDYRSKGKLSFILDIMQCAADFAVGNLGISIEEILNAGMGWMMITLDLELKRVPRPNDQLTVRTWSKGTKGALWQRDFRIFDEDDIEIATARSIWALVDIEKRKILRPSALPVQVKHYNGDSVGDMPVKVTIPSDIPMNEGYRYQVRYSGLDNNGHLNNARYGDLCCDALSLTEWDTAEIKRFRITYAQEAKLGDELTVLRSAVTDAGIYVRGQNSDTAFFEACIELRDNDK